MPDPHQQERVNPSPSAVIGLKLFRSIGRRIVRQRKSKKNSSGDESSCSSQKNDKEKSDSSSRRTSTDSLDQPHKQKNDRKESVKSETASERTSGSDTAALLSQVFKMLSVRRHSSPNVKPPQKSILRQAPCHIHCRGISGLPTQRVPVNRSYYRHPHEKRRQAYRSAPGHFLLL